MPNDQQMRLKSEKHYSSSIDKSLRTPKKQQENKIGPILLGVFLFVIVGSTLFQILNVTNQSGDDILALPTDIRNLPRYIVPNQMLICTTIILIFFLVWALAMFFIWAWRSFKHIHNYQYVVDHNIRRQFQHAKKTYKQKIQRERQEENQVFQSEHGESNITQYSPELQAQQMVYNRQQSRLLQLACLSVIVAININTFSCNIMEVVTYLGAVLVFTVFNVFRVLQRINFLRLLFFLPLIAAYLPFFIFKKELITI